MVEHLSDYPWSSYRSNTSNYSNELLVLHELYNRLGVTSKERQENYRAFLDEDVPERTIEEVGDAINKSQVLGSGYFKDKIVGKINRSMSPRYRGGDRKSKAFQQKTKRVLLF